MENHKENNHKHRILSSKKGRGAEVRGRESQVVDQRVGPEKAKEISAGGMKTCQSPPLGIRGVAYSQAWGRGYHGIPVAEIHHTVTLCLRNMEHLILKTRVIPR